MCRIFAYTFLVRREGGVEFSTSNNKHSKRICIGSWSEVPHRKYNTLDRMAVDPLEATMGSMETIVNFEVHTQLSASCSTGTAS